MHDYRLYNDKYEFHLLASDEDVALIDESTQKQSKYMPIYEWEGDVSADKIASDIHVYIYGTKKAEQGAAANP